MYNPYVVMYDAKMDIVRYEEIEVDNITKHTKKMIGQNRPCRYSSSGQVQTEGAAPEVSNSHKLFCSIEEDVKEGDHLIITMRAGKVVEVDLGECHPYTYQWQCEIKRKDYA